MCWNFVFVWEQARCQDILSHQTMMDSISDKGMALASAQVQNRLRQLNTKYNTLCSKAQVHSFLTFTPALCVLLFLCLPTALWCSLQYFGFDVLIWKQFSHMVERFSTTKQMLFSFHRWSCLKYPCGQWWLDCGTYCLSFFFFSFFVRCLRQSCYASLIPYFSLSAEYDPDLV